MNNSTRGLIATIAGFLALGFAAIALFYWAAFEGFTLDFSQLDVVMRVLIVGAIVGLSIFILANPESVGRSAGKRSTRLTANALVASLVAVAIAVVVNILTENVSTARADWTAGQDFTLSAQTIKLLGDIDKKGANIQAVAFIQTQDTQTRQQAADLLTEYASRTRKITYQIVDPFRQPGQAAAFGITRDGVVVFTDGKKRETANSVSEREFTSALVRLGQNTTRTVAFLTGHGERDITGQDQAGYAQISDSLTQNNYKVLTWSLVTSPTLSVNNVNVLVIAQPQRAITAKEIASIQQYLDGGGRLLAIMDPVQPADAQKPMRDLLTKYGIEPVQGVVLDPESIISQGDITVLSPQTYPPTDITAELQRSKLRTIFAASLGFKEGTPKPGFRILPVIQSAAAAPQGWLETDLTSNQQPAYDAGKDLPGPVDMATLTEPADLSASTTPTATNPVTNTVNTRIVAFGDGDFPSNVVLQQDPYNVDLFGNTVSYLSGANELVSIRPKDPAQTRSLLLDAGQKSMVFITSVLGLPLLVGLAGILVWWRRR